MYTIRHNAATNQYETRNSKTMSTKITIPQLPSWTKEGSKYTLFRAGLGYLHIRPAATGYTLTVRPDLDGVRVGDPQILAQGATPAFLVARAQQMYSTQHDQPVKHNTFQ